MTSPVPTLAQRVEGGMLGLVIGDALGVPYEFQPPHALPGAKHIELQPPAWFARSHPGVEPGTWSDDGAQALCLLESLLQQGRFDPDDFARRMVNWYEWGHLAVGGEVFDVGLTTAGALRAIRDGTPALEAASREVSANGNGALMRVLPLALWHQGSDAELVHDARLSSVVTHGHLRSQLCCALYCLWIRRMLAEAGEPWSEAVAALRAVIGADESAELELHIRPELAPAGRGSGYVVDSLQSARMVLSRGPYEQVVKAAIALGDDTDTTAAIAGGAAGVRDGIGAIPARWLEALRGRELLDPMLTQLLAHHGLRAPSRA
jgi:ADP-ribosyl-[dinitrogen reductase] hydrolase